MFWNIGQINTEKEILSFCLLHVTFASLLRSTNVHKYIVCIYCIRYAAWDAILHYKGMWPHWVDHRTESKQYLKQYKVKTIFEKQGACETICFSLVHSFACSVLSLVSCAQVVVIYFNVFVIYVDKIVIFGSELHPMQYQFY